MDYSRPLKNFRLEADNFDYDSYLQDEANGMFDSKPTAVKIPDAREGLMSRTMIPSMRPDPEITPEMMGSQAGGLGSIARRFIEIRKKRRASKALRPLSEGGLPASSRAEIDNLVVLANLGNGKNGLMARPNQSFKDKMMMSESSGKTDTQITIDDGRKMTGGFQFSDARLKDAMKGMNIKFTTEEFRNDPELQDRVMDWHISDIDRVIDTLDTDMSRDGLRAVAHLGGISGMKKFVKTQGKHNPKDKFGTSLQDYFDKFSKVEV